MPNKTIYFTQTNSDKLSKEENPNGLINRLVMNYYASTSRSTVFESVAKAKKMQANKRGDDNGEDNSYGS